MQLNNIYRLDFMGCYINKKYFIITYDECGAPPDGRRPFRTTRRGIYLVNYSRSTGHTQSPSRRSESGVDGQRLLLPLQHRSTYKTMFYILIATNNIIQRASAEGRNWKRCRRVARQENGGETEEKCVWSRDLSNNERKRSTEIRMLRWMCGVTRYDMNV